MPFLYLRDPLFLTVFTLYWVNKLVIKNVAHPQFFDAYFNGLICIPFFVPILLSGLRRLHIRRNDLPPRLLEVMIPTVVWSILFEIIFPQSSFWSKWVTGDPIDIMFYAAGGCFSLVFWEWWYLVRPARQERQTLDR